MPTFDDLLNFAWSTVVTAPSPATSGLSLEVDGGDWPATPFNAVVWPSVGAPTQSEAEVVRVTNIAGFTTFTIVRSQEGTSARSILVGDRIMAAITAKTLTDMQAAILGPLTVIDRNVFTTPGSDTMTPNVDTSFLMAEVIAGGGGGGGVNGASSEVGVGGGGAGGCYIRTFLPGPFTTYSFDFTVGAGGAGGVTGVADGATGDNSSFDDSGFFGTIEAGGGGGGQNGTHGTTQTVTIGGAGGDVVTYDPSTDLFVVGDPGGWGVRFSGTFGWAGHGGRSFSGAETPDIYSSLAPANTFGNAYGGGGSGAVSAAAGNVAGGDGADGCVIVTEFGAA